MKVLQNADPVFLTPPTRFRLAQDPNPAAKAMSETDIQPQNFTDRPPTADDWHAMGFWTDPAFTMTASAQIGLEERHPQRNDPLAPIFGDGASEQTIRSYFSTEPEPFSIPTVSSLSGSSGIETPEGGLTPIPCPQLVLTPPGIDFGLLAVKEPQCMSKCYPTTIS